MRLRMRALATLIILAMCAGAVGAGQARARIVAPAAFLDGALPALPAMALGGGEVVVELTVGERGAVTAVRPLRGTVPYTELVVGAVGGWRFSPAEELIDPADRRPGEGPTRAIASKVTVAALYRPPSFYSGSSLGEPAHDLDRPSDEAPFPISTTLPVYTSVARDGGVVLVEARVDESGAVSQVTLKRSRPPFDDAAVDAAREWRFRPARLGNTPAMARTYLLFGFRVPDGIAAGTR